MNTRIKTLIVEDEAPARRLLQEFLKEFPGIEVLEECTDGFEGARRIMELKPDLIFLDVQMPRINGFEMLELLRGEDMPLIIFTTAFDEFAIRSFEYNTCDYLLKPLNRERFQKAVTKALEQLKDKKSPADDLNSMVDQALGGGKYLDRIVIRSGSNIQVVYCDDLLCLEASDDYVIVHTAADQWVKKQTLKFYEEKLDPAEFLRVHRSFVVKISAISRIEPYSKDAYIAILHNGLKVSVSKAGYSRLKEMLNF
ncbi:MAG: LytTR family transcriptional regulator DNA-binding domain-containing protein [Mariniphaga sp.]|nr:LytTR family transcriptional regulator DNA-binding domain-containing protein [Mariniphaga sp.]